MSSVKVEFQSNSTHKKREQKPTCKQFQHVRDTISL